MFILNPQSVCLSVTLVYCGKMAGWIKMPLGTEVGIGPCDIVLDGDSAPPPTEGTAAPSFRPISATAELLSVFSYVKDLNL